MRMMEKRKAIFVSAKVKGEGTEPERTWLQNAVNAVKGKGQRRGVAEWNA
jgi:hypothetical protein